jgi:hypothetical protein
MLTSAFEEFPACGSTVLRSFLRRRAPVKRQPVRGIVKSKYGTVPWMCVQRARVRQSWYLMAPGEIALWSSQRLSGSPNVCEAACPRRYTFSDAWWHLVVQQAGP